MTEGTSTRGKIVAQLYPAVSLDDEGRFLLGSGNRSMTTSVRRAYSILALCMDEHYESFITLAY